MGYSQADKARSRERILDAAARQISEHGLDSVSVADSMQSAGLTKGAFYAHFASREAMLAEAVDRMMQHGQAGIDQLFRVKKKPSVAEIADVWLNPEHIENLGDGCGICALAGEARYAGPAARQVIAGYFEKNVEQIAQALGGGRAATARATAILTAIVGAVNMARAVDSPELTQVILENTRAMVTHPAFLKCSSE
ncbi:TetR/AcrR family transcriptional regulator [Caballeronia sp. SEWSISQ10-4 2]|uniref:TetR/AcrR family transcriptional regulator n=1 Tax=Caballeronia sp. SEWSISQ10-4 2 TaxID=2937438 RepID=UPI00264B06B4|nr:TetR/AcrR family transcriptional regulator [Caballeronia sp. SEWSISQ10-4 2]MDN7178449.1 TetR/AcrR family transcriptional regulator [Caballeronia sp. SEWSISQ10-4 2]